MIMRTRRIIFLLLFFSFLTAVLVSTFSFAGPEEETEHLYREALQFYKDKDFEKARVKFIQVRMRDKDYKSTDSFLRRLDEQLQFLEKKKEEEAADRALQRKQKAELKKERSYKMDRKLQRELARQKARRERKERDAREKKQWEKQKAEDERRALLMKKKRDEGLAREQKEREQRLQEREEKRKAELEEKKRKAEDALAKKKEAREQKKMQREAMLAQKRQLFEQSEKMGDVRKVYSAAVTFYKRGEFHLAKYKLDDVKKMMSTTDFTEKFIADIRAKHARLTEKIALAEEKVRFAEQRKKQKAEDRKAAQKEKENSQKIWQAEQQRKRQEKRQTALEQQMSMDLAQKKALVETGGKKAADARQPPLPEANLNEAVAQKAELKEELQRGVDDLYRDGIDLYRAGSVELAAEILFQVDKIWPDYKLTRYYLELIAQKKGMDAFSAPQGARLKAVEEALDAFKP